MSVREVVADVTAITFFVCAEHVTNLTGESPVTGIYRQV